MIVSTAIVGSVVGALTPLSWSGALLFGALISATDPVAVVALFKDLRVPGRLSVLVDGESLFNDGTAIVLFLIILSAGASGGVGPLTVVRGAVEFVWVSRPGASGPQVNVTPRVSTSEGTRPVAGPSDMPGPSGRDLAE